MLSHMKLPILKDFDLKVTNQKKLSTLKHKKRKKSEMFSNFQEHLGQKRTRPKFIFHLGSSIYWLDKARTSLLRRTWGVGGIISTLSILLPPKRTLILCHPLLLLPPILASIRVFSNESALCMRWPKYWSFSFSIIPSKEIPGLISFRMASLTRWTWAWLNSGNWWWTGRPGVPQFMGSQRVGHNWATEMNWTELTELKPYWLF